MTPARSWTRIALTCAGLTLAGPVAPYQTALAEADRSTGAASRPTAPARQAGAGHISGTIRYEQVTNPGGIDGAVATWNVDGQALPVREEASLVGITNLTGLSNTDERFAHAELATFVASKPPVSCGDGTSATTTTTYPGIVDPSSAISMSFMSVDLYDGTGRVSVNIAESQTRPEGMFAPGTVSVHLHSECYGSVSDETSTVAVMGRSTDGEPITSYWANQDVYSGHWKLAAGQHGGWVVSQHRVLSKTSYDKANETVRLRITGNLRGLHADCVLPTAHRLHPATSYAQADRIAETGGFTDLRHVAKASRAAPKGHFFVLEAIGQRSLPCGERRLHLVKSLGWPS